MHLSPARFKPLSLEGRGVGERVMVQISTAFTLSPQLRRGQFKQA